MNTQSLTASELSELTKSLTPHELAELDHLLGLKIGPTRSTEASNLTAFKHALYQKYTHAPHLEALDRALERVSLYAETGGEQGTWLLIVAMPPRHGKTLTTSKYYPAWHLGRNPDHRVMLVSYGQSLADKNSRAARGIISDHRYGAIFPGVDLNKTSRAVDAWDIDEHEGGGDALGVLGSATGKGANLLICDDLIKNRQEAESLLIRDRTWDAFNDDLLSRLEPGGAIVLMATRWHQDDPTGRMIAMLQNADAASGPVEMLVFPALAEGGDPLGRQPGEALWPARYSTAELRAIETRSAPYSWSALYQQRPTPAEGGIFKRVWFDPAIHHPPQFEYAVRYWDLAMSGKTSADYTVGVKLGFATDGHHYVLDVVRKQIEWGELTPFMADVILRDGPHVAQGIEQKGYMSRAIQDLNADARLHGHVIRGYPVDTDKLTRALPVAGRAAAGMLHLIAAHWNQTFIEELCSFPNAGHDDQVDALSGAWVMMGQQTGSGEVYLATDDTFGIGSY